MIRRDIANVLRDIANNKGLCDMLIAYAEFRVSQIHTSLDNTNDTNTVFRNQGAIAEVKRLATLREEILAGLKE